MSNGMEKTETNCAFQPQISSGFASDRAVIDRMPETRLTNVPIT